ncbi:hypothetical protein IWZ00DRAFT_547099 [Phyllosticta capitalensis]
MARKKSSIPPSIRLRENQRRSRASHKSYVAELQAKIAAYEQRGIQVSLALQQAARSVAQENRLLRELLALKGVEEGEVDGWVRKRAMAGDKLIVPGEGDGGVTTTTPVHMPGNVPVIPQSWHPSLQSLNVDQNISPNMPPLCTSTTQPRAAVAIPSSTTKSTPAAVAAAEGCRRGLEMSCQEAAAIIAAMRGGRYLYGDVDASVRSELGCDADALLESCRVGNVRLMDVMDGEGEGGTT